MARRSKSKPRGSRLSVFAAGVAVGLALALWVYPKLTQWWQEPASSAVANNPASSPTFDFYDILERGEVVVEETPAPPPQGSRDSAASGRPEPLAETPGQPPAGAAAGSGTAQQASGPVETSGTYVLQMGAFTREVEAEALKARLALVGIDSRIQPVRRDRQTYYRVRTSPTSDLERLNADRARLKEHRFHYLRLTLAE